MNQPSTLEEDRELAHRFGAINHERAERADERIAELESALREIRYVVDWRDYGIDVNTCLLAIKKRIDIVVGL